MKKFPFIFLLVFLAACSNATPTPTIQPFTQTVAVPTLNPVTETPTATEVPETPEQKATRLASEAVGRGEKANEWQTWTDVYYKNILENAHNPQVVSEEQLKELGVYMTAFRRAEFLRFLHENPTAAIDIVQKFVRGFLPSASTENIEQLVQNLTPEQRMYLEIVYRASMQEPIMRSPVEKIHSNTIPLPKYNEKYNGETLVSAYGVYESSPNSAYIKDTFPITMYGRTVFDGKPLESGGGFSPSAKILMDFVGVDISPQGTTILGLMKEGDAVRLVDFQVVTTDDQPIKFDSSTQYPVGGWASDRYAGAAPAVEFTRTMLGSAGYDSFRSDLTLATRDQLLNHLEWSPQYIYIIVPSEHAIDKDNRNKVQTMFLHPITGLITIGSSETAFSAGYMTGIYFYQTDRVDGFRNSWP